MTDPFPVYSFHFAPVCMTSSLAVIVVILLLGASLALASAVVPNRPPPRTATPTFRRLHVLSNVLFATPSHATAPFEICKQLTQRSHRVTWVDMHAHDGWYSVDERHEANFHRWEKAGDDVMTNFTTVWAYWLDQHVQRGMESLDDVSRYVMEPLYSPSMRTLQRLIAEERPDVMICDAFAQSCVDIADQLSIPFILAWPGGLGSFGLGNAFDTPDMMTHYSHYWHEQPLAHRLWNTYAALPYIIHLLGGIEPRVNNLRTQFGIQPNVAPTDKWLGRDIIFNGHWGWDWAGYVPPYFHLLGPITRTSSGKDLKAASNIEPTLRQWMDESEQRGIPLVYMALGSTAFFTEREQIILLSAFTSCPALPLPTASNAASNATSASSDSSAQRFRVVWQSNKPLAASTRAAMPDWVREEKWVAQQAVLSHPATSLFVSHGGSQSMQEGIAAGLPLLATSFYGDQSANAARLRDKGAALSFDRKRVTEQQLCDSMRHLVYDQRVRDSVDRVQQLYHLTTDGAARGADVVERAAYVGTEHLIPYRERKDVSVIVRYNIDVYAIGVAMVLAVLYGFYRVLALLVVWLVRLVGVRSKSKQA